MVVEIEKFFGCYLLLNVNPQFKDRTYIGYTVNPRRRVSQHNKGRQFGGAKRTSGRGPWEMVLIVYGFPNNISALKFEWVWQKPRISRRLRHVPGKRKDEKRFTYDLRVLSNMLKTAPWCRLPLTVQWLKQEHMREFEAGLQPPPHMPIAFGPVTSIKMHSSKKKSSPRKKKRKDVGSTSEEGDKDAAQQESDDMVDMISVTQTVNKRCDLCMKRIQEVDCSLSCVHPACSMLVHIICLATKFLKRSSESDQLLPVEGNCPVCKNNVLWGDLIRKKQGCYSNLSASEENEDSEDHWAEDLRL